MRSDNPHCELFFSVYILSAVIAIAVTFEYLGHIFMTRYIVNLKPNKIYTCVSVLVKHFRHILTMLWLIVVTEIILSIFIMI